MKIFLITLVSLISLLASAQTEQSLITQAEKYETALNENAAFDT
jgi:hypothetical protein